MDVAIGFFFILISFIGVVISRMTGNIGIGLIGSTGLMLTGFAFITSGLDVNVQTSQVSNFTATDLYLYNWNATFNQSTVANVTTTYNRTQFNNYIYVNETTDYTRLFAMLLMGIGLASGFSVWGSRPSNTVEED